MVFQGFQKMAQQGSQSTPDSQSFYFIFQFLVLKYKHVSQGYWTSEE